MQIVENQSAKGRYWQKVISHLSLFDKLVAKKINVNI